MFCVLCEVLNGCWPVLIAAKCQSLLLIIQLQSMLLLYSFIRTFSLLGKSTLGVEGLVQVKATVPGNIKLTVSKKNKASESTN